MATAKKPNPGFSTLSRAEQQRINQMTPAQLRAYNQGQRGGGTPATDTGGAPAINYKDPVSISGEVARQGLAAGSDPTTRAAQVGTQNILAGQGGAGSGTGYQYHNPINDALAQRLLQEPTDAENMLREFIGGGLGGGTSAPRNSGGTASGAGYGRTWTLDANGNTVPVVTPAGAGSGAGGGFTATGPGIVPDTVGPSDAYFATELKKLMDSGANDADIQAVIDAANADVNRGLTNSLWDLDAAAQGTGRLGGDTWAGLGSQARSDAAKQMLANASGVRLGEVANRRALYQNLLGQVNTRDLGAMQDATNRYGIDQSAAAARAGSGAAAAAAAAQERGQNLQALLAIQGGQQFNTGQLSGLGGQLSGDQVNAIQMAPGLAGINLSGLGAANNAAGNQVALRGAQIQGGVARMGLNQQAQMFNSGLQQQQLNDYLRTVLGIGGLGGTSTTQGTNVVPGLGLSPTGAAIQGGIGGGLAAWGYGRG